MKMLRSVDLSHPIHSEMPVYPGDPTVSISPATTINHDGFNVLHVQMGSQSGTHIDAPLHFIDGGATIDSYPVETFVGPAFIAQAVGVGDNGVIGADTIPDPGQPGALLMIRSDWSQYWGGERYFSHPYLSPEAAQRIVDCGYKAIGIDALSVDQTDGSTGDFTAHMILLEAGIPICENLTGVAQVDWPTPWLSLVPIRLEGADGAPIRAFALEIDHS